MASREWHLIWVLVAYLFAFIKYFSACLCSTVILTCVGLCWSDDMLTQWSLCFFSPHTSIFHYSVISSSVFLISFWNWVWVQTRAYFSLSLLLRHCSGLFSLFVSRLPLSLLVSTFKSLTDICSSLSPSSPAISLYPLPPQFLPLNWHTATS